MNSFIIGNTDKCIGCGTCLIACVEAHSKDNIFLSKEKDIEFNPRLCVIKTASLTGPVQCRQCENAVCLIACPNGSITQKDGTVTINKDTCIGCKTCAVACPLAAIEMASIGNKVVANKCDLCASRENGPACVEVCLTGALTLVTEEKVKDTSNERRFTSLADLDFISKETL